MMEKFSATWRLGAIREKIKNFVAEVLGTPVKNGKALIGKDHNNAVEFDA